jgi:hypothetical protein
MPCGHRLASFNLLAYVAEQMGKQLISGKLRQLRTRSDVISTSTVVAAEISKPEQIFEETTQPPLNEAPVMVRSLHDHFR